MISWIYLFLAAITEVLFNIGLFHSRGFTVFWPSVMAVAAGAATAVFLGFAMKTLPIGLAVTVWGGGATVAAAVYGIVALNEPRDWPRLAFIALVIGGMAGLKFTSPS
jgi:quaternary ammonium compound-resistance protein SugE